MPGSSLWLLPPTSHPLSTLLPQLLKSTSLHFSSVHTFLPHVTLTSSISASQHASGAQKWLDGLALPAGKDVQVEFQGLGSEDAFVRKLYVRCEKNEGMRELGRVCRGVVEGEGEEGEEEVEKWVGETWMPHLSLLYHDIPKVEKEGLMEVERLARDVGINVGGSEGLDGWVGGRVVLVPTDKPIHDWAPIAERVL